MWLKSVSSYNLGVHPAEARVLFLAVVLGDMRFAPICSTNYNKCLHIFSRKNLLMSNKKDLHFP